jgi:hypothetical protein
MRNTDFRTSASVPPAAAACGLESGAEPARAVTTHPAPHVATNTCGVCGYENVAGADQCARPGCRKVLKGNALSRRVGLYAAATTPELIAIEDAGLALFEQSVADAGGRDELIAREVAQHRNRALLQTKIDKVALALDTHGLFDRRGRLRVGWISQLESLISTALAIDKTLGLSRRPRRIDPMAAVRQAVEEANR